MNSSRRPGGQPPSGRPGGVVPVVGAAAAFVVLTGLVQAGAFTRLDQFSLDHLMPWLAPSQRSGSTLSGLVLPFGPRTNAWCRFLDLWTYPCSVLLSGLAVATAVAVCLRRRRALAGLALAGAWLAGNAVEVVGKHLVRRPPLYGHVHGLRVEVVPFLNSFPSGHMIRGLVVVAAVGLVAPAARPALLGWVALVGPFLVVSSAHTVSDVLGGALVGCVLIVAARALASSPELDARVTARLERALATRRQRAAVP
jgi:membrane-associated phospholipid phosphatase